jgi:peptidyl-tRNA hydrolase
MRKCANCRHNIGKVAAMYFMQQYTRYDNNNVVVAPPPAASWTHVKAVHGETMRRVLRFDENAKVFGSDDLIDNISARRKSRTEAEGVPYPSVDLHMLLPSTYMNRSGMSVKSFMNQHHFRCVCRCILLSLLSVHI